ncbi:hypothetical protein PYW07_004056 [Mythimna separata]|uniref:Endonuclease-reverse transcriptase n=1 Tax=Mythimna separata TaxID=271217 RepID=A0AAD7YNZ9_MYTSE|nr:hypothetical protein PYW07_004056 [Mythimna separata]
MSDHQLLVCNMRIRLRKPVAKKVSRRMEVMDVDSFVQSLQEKDHCWHENCSTEANVDYLWKSTVQLIKDAVRESQPNNRSEKRQHWMSADTWNLIKERRDLKAKGSRTQELNAMTSVIQAACRRDRNTALQSICEEVERHSQKSETKDLHRKIRLITRQFRPRTWAIENVSGNTITEIKEIVNVWKDYCKGLFADVTNDTTTTHDESLEQEPMPLKDEVVATASIQWLEHLSAGSSRSRRATNTEYEIALGSVTRDNDY